MDDFKGTFLKVRNWISSFRKNTHFHELNPLVYQYVGHYFMDFSEKLPEGYVLSLFSPKIYVYKYEDLARHNFKDFHFQVIGNCYFYVIFIMFKFSKM